MPDHIDSVKEYLRVMGVWRKDAEAKGEDAAVKRYDSRITAIAAVVDEVEHLRRITKPVPASYGDLSDLPPELVKELTGIKVDDLEQQLFTIIKTGGNEVDLDAILIELFRRFEVIQTRKFLQNKLWRMAQKEIVYSVPNRKGVYSATKPASENVEPEDLAPAPPAKPENSGGWGSRHTSSFDDDLDSDIPF